MRGEIENHNATLNITCQSLTEIRASTTIITNCDGNDRKPSEKILTYFSYIEIALLLLQILLME